MPPDDDAIVVRAEAVQRNSLDRSELPSSWRLWTARHRSERSVPIAERLRHRIRMFLGRASAIRQPRRAGQRMRVRLQPGSPVWLGVRSATASSPAAVPAPAVVAVASTHDRRAARRYRTSDLPSLRAVRLPWGEDVSVVDLSSAGALLETTSLLPPGSDVALDVLGDDTRESLSARVLRARVHAVHAAAARWHVAAAFDRELNVSGLARPAATAVSPRVLGDLLTRVLGDQAEDVPWDERRARFESELAPLVRARAIFLRDAPVIHDPSAESIYFNVPHSSGVPLMLQVLFDANARPSAAEFRLLRAAAALAAVVLACSPGASTRSASTASVLAGLSVDPV